ncbi:MAG: xanthine dehydrogenase family protein subunit M [Elusimicrobia bacterium]|nr:xanthine dehydrogenase family protein subunit M [Elusimicrobiota bacterium]
MPITTEFDYVKPKTLNEALHLLALYKETAKVLAGGTDLIVHLKENMVGPEVVVDIKAVPGLNTITLDGYVLKLGALATFSELIGSSLIKTKFPLLREMAGTVASTGVRNRATIAGNICSAVPSADSAPVLEVYDAFVVAQSLRGRRKIAINDWFAGPRKTVLAPDELVTGIEAPLFKTAHGGCYAKLSRYEGEDLAQGAVAVLAFADNTYRIAACALAPKPARALRTEALLNGKKLTDKLISEAKELIVKEINPITDIRSSKEYRSHMTAVMLERALKAAAERICGKGPKYGESVV